MLYQGSYIPVSADLKTKSTTTMFIIGSIFWTLGNVLHVIGLTYAPTSLLGPVNSLGLIITMWLSWQLLGEELNRHLVISSCFTILGIIICLIASLKESQTDLYVTLESWHDSIYLYFGLFLVLTLIVIGATILTMNWEYENEFIRHFEREDYLSDNYIKLTPVVSQGNEASRPVHHSVAMALLAGIFGSQTVCEIKEMQAYWELAGLTVLTLPTFYLALVLLVSAAVCQFPLLSKAIESSSGNAVIPTATYHSSWCIFSVIGGSIKFKEYEGLPISRILLFALGISIVVVSTYITSTAMTLHPADSKGSTLLIGPLLPPWPKQDPLRD